MSSKEKKAPSNHNHIIDFPLSILDMRLIRIVTTHHSAWNTSLVWQCNISYFWKHSRQIFISLDEKWHDTDITASLTIYSSRHSSKAINCFCLIVFAAVERRSKYLKLKWISSGIFRQVPYIKLDLLWKNYNELVFDECGQFWDVNGRAVSESRWVAMVDSPKNGTCMDPQYD